MKLQNKLIIKESDSKMNLVLIFCKHCINYFSYSWYRTQSKLNVLFQINNKALSNDINLFFYQEKTTNSQMDNDTQLKCKYAHFNTTLAVV